MGITPNYSVSNLIAAKDQAYALLVGDDAADRVSATEAFVEAAQGIFRETYDNTLCYSANLKTIQKQASDILASVDRDNEVLNAIMPLAQEMHLLPH